MQRLEKPIYQLLKNEPFFAHFLLGCRIIFDLPEVQTASVSVNKGDITFAFNTKWFFDHPVVQQTAIIKHEIFHLLLEHCGSRGIGITNKMAFNVALDCAINQHIPNLPNSGVTLQSLQKLTKKPLLPFETGEYYYNEMKEVIEEANSQPHDHDFMQKGDSDETGEASGAVKEQARIAVKHAAGQAVAASAGNVPDAVQGILGKLNAAAKIPWKQQLRNFVSSARSTKNKNTRMKPNRRFELEQPGRKKIRELVLGVCTDSSGSVSDESYAAFMNEIASISKNTKITYLVHADCQVQKVDVIKDGKAKAGVLTTRHGAGGTAYQPAIDKCIELRCDAIIYFGDMDSADKPKNPGIPFIWVRVGKQTPPGDFGRILDI